MPESVVILTQNLFMSLLVRRKPKRKWRPVLYFGNIDVCQFFFLLQNSCGGPLLSICWPNTLEGVQPMQTTNLTNYMLCSLSNEMIFAKTKQYTSHHPTPPCGAPFDPQICKIPQIIFTVRGAAIIELLTKTYWSCIRWLKYCQARLSWGF